MTIVAVTALAPDAQRMSVLAGTLARYGLKALGGVWETTPQKVLALDWRPMVDAFIAQRAALWLVLADAKALQDPAVRYGLNLIAASLRSALGADFGIAVLWPDVPDVPVAGDGADVASRPALPAQLRDALVLEAGPAWPAKLVARVHRARSAAAVPADRVSVHGNEQLGQWIELAPGAGSWQGVVFAVAGEGAAIDFQATGPSGGLPETATIAYGQSGLKLESAGRAFTGWALRNEIGATASGAVSYYARVRGRPDALLWMPYTEEDGADATLLALD
jgi:hypothetical protein